MQTEILDNILVLLKRVKKSGNGWSACCPAHDDRKNSLSVTQGADETVLIKCHAGCTIQQIMESMGLQVRDLFPQKPDTNSQHSRQTPRQIAMGVLVEIVGKNADFA